MTVPNSPITDRRTLVLSVHDVAPSTFQVSKRAVRRMEQFGVTCSLLVVPGQWNGASLSDSPKFIDWLHECEARGHEIVQHGYTHEKLEAPSWSRVQSAVLTRGCNEFHSLGYSIAIRRMELGLQQMANYDFAPTGFVPPGWLASEGTIQAAKDLGFAYLTTRTRFLHLAAGQSHTIPAWSHRPNSTLSFAGALWWQIGTASRVLFPNSLRLALHPGDVADKKLMDVSERCVRRLLDSGYESYTYQELIAPKVLQAC